MQYKNMLWKFCVLVARRLVERAPGQVLTMGSGDVGQLGLGPDKLECTRPARVQGLNDVVYMCAGGMHSVCLDSHGQVGCLFCLFYLTRVWKSWPFINNHCLEVSHTWGVQRGEVSCKLYNQIKKYYKCCKFCC